MQSRRNEQESSTPPRKRARLTLYDAVAGRANYKGFRKRPKPSIHRDTGSTTFTAVPPEEILFGFRDAPDRYEEDDFYSADRHLDQSEELQRLPDSDLLKALHAYASDFYATVGEDRGRYDWGSLDETALLALGILIEEAAGQFWRRDGKSRDAEQRESPQQINLEKTNNSDTLDFQIKREHSSPADRKEDIPQRSERG